MWTWIGDAWMEVVADLDGANEREHIQEYRPPDEWRTWIPLLRCKIRYFILHPPLIALRYDQVGCALCSAVHATYPLCSQLLTRTRGLTWIYSWANASTDENWRVMTKGMERPRQHWQEGPSIHPNCVHFPLWHMYFWNSSNRRCGSKRTASGWDAILVPVRCSPVEEWGKIRKHVQIKW